MFYRDFAAFGKLGASYQREESQTGAGCCPSMRYKTLPFEESLTGQTHLWPSSGIQFCLVLSFCCSLRLFFGFRF